MTSTEFENQMTRTNKQHRTEKSEEKSNFYWEFVLEVSYEDLPIVNSEGVLQKPSQETSGEEKKPVTRSMIIPTDDTVVKMKLRELDEPICEWDVSPLLLWIGLFGESPGDRRERLRLLLSVIGSWDVSFRNWPRSVVQISKDGDLWCNQEGDFLIGVRTRRIRCGTIRGVRSCSKRDLTCWHIRYRGGWRFFTLEFIFELFCD